MNEIKRYPAFDMVGVHPVNYKLDKEGDLCFWDDIERMIKEKDRQIQVLIKRIEQLEYKP